MEKTDPSSADSARGHPWLESLPASERAAASRALDELPVDPAAAGEDLPLAIAAWMLADPATAARLFESWLATAAGDGPWFPPCPVLCQWAERIAEALPDAEAFVARILPGLARGLEKEIDHFDVKGTGLPVWPSREEALFSEEQAPGRFTVDLAVLLSNEAESFCRLARDQEEQYAKVLDNAEGEQRELDVWLKDNFWNEEEGTFYRWEESGNSSLDFSPCMFMTLVWGGRTPEMVEGIRPRASAWDATQWPARAWVLFFALLMPTPHNSVVARMQRDGLPKGASPVAAAAWGVLSAGADLARTEHLEGIPAVARWLDARGRMLALAGGGAGVLVLAVLLVWAFVWRDVPLKDMAGLERLARQASAEGRHDQAAALYGQAARFGREAYFRYRQAGEWLRLGYDEAAEEAYRTLLDQEPDAPNVKLNLALAVWRQGRREEALHLYREFAQPPHETRYPDLAARARLAAELIERQIELDRE